MMFNSDQKFVESLTDEQRNHLLHILARVRQDYEREIARLKEDFAKQYIRQAQDYDMSKRTTIGAIPDERPKPKEGDYSGKQR